MPEATVTAAPAHQPRREREDAAARSAGLAVSRWRALGTSAQVVVTEAPRLAAATQVVIRILDRIDLAASRFRPDSELTRVNRNAGSWVDVSPLLLTAIRVALGAAEATDGLVDPTVGSSLVRLGYDRTFRLVAADGPPVELRVAAVPGWQQVEIDARHGRVRIPPETMLDLGATAKGLAADLAAEKCHGVVGCGVLVNLGGDIALAGDPPAAGGWPIAVGDSGDVDADVDVDAGSGTAPTQTIALHGGGLATSSTTARRWRRGGSTIHHIIDPRSGLPSTAPWRTISVVANSCVQANTLSTGAIVRGVAAPSWLSEWGNAARLVAADGEVITIGGWPQDGARPGPAS